MLNYVIHILGALQFTFGCYYDWYHVIVPKSVAPIMSAYGGKFKFLTFWDAVMQALYFTLCVIIDIGGFERQKTSNKQPQHAICKLRDYIFTALAFPIALFVSVTFWGLYAVNRELVLPAVLDPYFPKWLNHVMHTCVGVWVILEMLTSFHVYPEKWKGLLGLLIFQSVYLTWMHIVYSQSGLWVYNIFNVLNVPQRIAFLFTSIAVGFLFYLLGDKLNSIIWGSDKRLKHLKKK
ncbi:androgen-induced gene 1 protein-like [Lycorma delicatula]|uniref:androgen-induced gene 1 protein-like n=1 Tax=Lycorma delicatula TaxID=130591 RepID=UPI003F518172